MCVCVCAHILYVNLHIANNELLVKYMKLPNLLWVQNYIVQSTIRKF